MLLFLNSLLALTVIASLIVVLYLLKRTRQLKQQQQMIVSKLKGKPFWRINIASPEYADRWLKLSPYEASGVLLDSGDALKIQAYWPKTSKLVEHTFPKNELEVEWLGNTTMRAGNLYWAQLSCKRGKVRFSADTGIKAMHSREALEDIFRGAFPDVDLNENETNDFALEKNPRTLAAIVLLFSLIAYALIDTFFISHYELLEQQLIRILTHPYIRFGWIPIGAGVMYLLYPFFKKGNVPARESWVMSGFLMGVFLLSAIPIAKRVDQFLAAAPAQDYEYRVVDGYRLEPVNASLGLPSLRFPKAREYWSQFEENAPYKIPLLNGPLGLWQLDHSKFDKPVRAFYENNKKQKQQLMEKIPPLAPTNQTPNQAPN